MLKQICISKFQLPRARLWGSPQRNMYNKNYRKVTLTAKGSACSQEIGAPHNAGRTRSGRDSGTAIKINSRSDAATNVASATTALSPCILPR